MVFDAPTREDSGGGGDGDGDAAGGSCLFKHVNSRRVPFERKENDRRMRIEK